ncbi:MAG: general secretion pathway protein GspK [Verrucomicrobia bacterium]|nr:general secretion pathway protein GspK [Verrucomicrobiota bacterium]
MKRGSALVVVLWILIIISLIVSMFAFEMQLEAKMMTLQRKRFKADQLALAGVELAKLMLAFEDKKKMPGEQIVYDEPWRNEAAKIAAGLPVNFTENLGDGTVTLHIDYENGKRCVKKMEREEWRLLFEQAGIPNTEWDTLLDCLDDWQDEDDLHTLNGAESDDPFYRKRGYKCKNAPIDTVDELLLIKGWTTEILYGTPPGKETDQPITGIANLLTTWGSGLINPNSAGTNVLNSLKISDGMIDAILELRLGPDGKEGTADDGIDAKDLAAMKLPNLFTLTPEYVSITSIGEVGGVRSKISCIFPFVLGEKAARPLFWVEGKVSE